MFRILGFLFVIVIAVIIIGLALVGSMLRAIFGLEERSFASDSRNQNSTHSNSGQRYYCPTQASDKKEIITETGTNRHKKLFDDNEGEYADYEETKD